MIKGSRGDANIFEALMKIMEPKMNEIRKSDMEKDIQKRRREGI